MRNRIFENREVDETIFELELKSNVCENFFDIYKKLNRHPLNFDLRYHYGKLVASFQKLRIEIILTKTKKFFINLSDDVHTICDMLIDDCEYGIDIKSSVTNVMNIILAIVSNIASPKRA